jgi:hypothetical protein
MVLAESLDHPYTLMIARLTIGHAYSEGDYPAESIPSLERGHALALSLELPSYVVVTASGLSIAYARAGRTDDAVPLARLGAQIARFARSRNAAGRMAVMRAEVFLLAGCLDEAREQVAFAMDVSKARRDRASQASTLRLLGELATVQEPVNLQEAESHYLASLALAEELEMRPLQARCHLGLGKVYRRADRVEEARVELTTAVELFEGMGVTSWLPDAQAELRAIG